MNAHRSTDEPMICCIVGLLILTTVGRLRRLLGLGAGETPALFAPVAQRPAPGQVLAAAAVVAEPATQRPRRDATVLGYGAAGVAFCGVAAPLLVLSGAAENTGSAGDWMLRNLCYLAVIVVAVVLSRSVGLWRVSRGPGPLMIVVGAVIFELGLMDMHVFGVLEMDHGNVMADMVFHGIGPILVLTGGLALLNGSPYGSTGRSTTS
jgi:hypothetical protein